MADNDPGAEPVDDPKAVRDAYDDLVAMLAGTVTVLDALPESQARNRLLRAIELTRQLATVVYLDSLNEPIGILTHAPLAHLLEILGMLGDLRRNIADQALLEELSARIFAWVEASARGLMRGAEVLPARQGDEARSQLRRIADLLSVERTLQRLEEAETSITARQSDVEEAADEVAATVQNAKEVVGAAAEGTLSGDFAAFGTRQERLAWLWSGISLTSLAVSAAMAWWTLRSLGQSFGAEQLGRLAITVPLFAMAIYAARVASNHRAAGLWAAINAVQLQTIRAYADTLTDEHRSTLRLEFGRRIFVSPAPDGEPASPTLVEPIALLDKATQLLKAGADTARAARP